MQLWIRAIDARRNPFSCWIRFPLPRSKERAAGMHARATRRCADPPTHQFAASRQVDPRPDPRSRIAAAARPMARGTHALLQQRRRATTARPNVASATSDELLREPLRSPPAGSFERAARARAPTSVEKTMAIRCRSRGDLRRLGRRSTRTSLAKNRKCRRVGSKDRATPGASAVAPRAHPPDSAERPSLALGFSPQPPIRSACLPHPPPLSPLSSPLLSALPAFAPRASELPPLPLPPSPHPLGPPRPRLARTPAASHRRLARPRPRPFPQRIVDRTPRREVDASLELCPSP